MAYVPKKPFAEVVLPIMVKKGSIMIGISTYGEPNNFFTKLLNHRAPDGSRMFRQIEYTTICRKCRAKGVKEVCKHRRGELPHWHDAGEYAQIFEMLKDDPDIAMKELGGVSVDSSVKPFFSATLIQEIQSGKSADGKIEYVSDLKHAHQDMVYVSVDPSGGGQYSEYAIVSAVFTMQHMVIVGIESTPCDEDAQQGNYVVRHISALRQQPAFRKSRFKIIVEINYGGPIWATNIGAAISLSRLPNVELARRDRRGERATRPGVFTLENTKIDMMERLRKLIQFKNLRFHRSVVSVCVPKTNAQEMIEEALHQLMGYRDSYDKDPVNPLRPVRRVLSGKIGPAGKDDVVDCIAMILYWYRQV